MSRLIQHRARLPALTADASRRATLPRAAPPPATPGDNLGDFLERIIKLIPAEIIAAYMLIRGLVPAACAPGALPLGAELALYVALLVLTPLYFIGVAGEAPRKYLQAGVATGSFVVWTYAIGGPFFWGALECLTQAQLVHGALAGALPIVWSLATSVLLRGTTSPPPEDSP